VVDGSYAPPSPTDGADFPVDGFFQPFLLDIPK
jgi:hypothetical protein